MSLKKQFAVTLASVGLGAALIGGGTFAYFNDVESSTGNTFATGTIDLKPELEGKVLFNVTNAAPGQTWNVDYALSNDGTLAANVSVNVDYTAVDGGTDGSDLANALIIKDKKLAFGTTDIDISVLDSNSDGKVTLAEFAAGTADTSKFALGDLGAKGGADASKNITFTLEFEDTGAPQNEYQGDSLNPVTITFEARQK
jgi:spore coat-associated protein N